MVNSGHLYYKTEKYFNLICFYAEKYVSYDLGGRPNIRRIEVCAAWAVSCKHTCRTRTSRMLKFVGQLSKQVSGYVHYDFLPGFAQK